MTRTRLLFVGLLTVMAACILTSASASAEKCREVSNLFCLSSTHELALFPLSSVSLESAELAKIEVEGYGKIECSAAKSTAGSIEEPVEAVSVKGLVVEFKTCKLAGNPECKVAAVVTKALGGPIGLLSEKPSILLAGENATKELVTLKVESCEFAGSLVIKGEQSCSDPKVEEVLVTQSVLCEKGGSELKAGVKAVSLTLLSGVKLTGTLAGEVWGIFVNLT